MNIYTHPNEIRKVSTQLSNATLVAWNIGNNYHMLNGLIFSIWHEGTGNFPELCESIPDNVYYITCPLTTQ